MAIDPEPIGWIRELAAPYLRGYRAFPERSQSLRGYWFLHPASPRNASPAARGAAEAKSPDSIGFFVGYLAEGSGYAYLSPQSPECLIFAFVAPAGGSLHRRLVAAPGSLMRKTFDYIRILTHRPPRFVFHEQELAAMTRHQSMRDWPREKHEHFSRNFFIEALAWLVRSGLVRSLLAEPLQPDRKRRAKPSKPARAARRKQPQKRSRSTRHIPKLRKSTQKRQPGRKDRKRPGSMPGRK